MKKLLTAMLAAGLCAGSVQALTITLDAESLKDSLGSAMPAGGLVILSAATTGLFSGPSPSSFATGDEIVLKRWDLSAFGMAGVLSASTGDLVLNGAWSPNDPLRLYWYPTLTLSSNEPGFGTSYGSYTDTVGLNGSAAWFTPNASDTISLKFFTSDTTFLSNGGSNPSSAGVANMQVVPEPSTAILAVAGGLAFLTRRRRRSTAG